VTGEGPAVDVRLPLPAGATVTGFAVVPGTPTSGPVAHYAADDGTVRSWDLDSGAHTADACEEWPARSGIVLAPGGRAVSQVDQDVLALWRLGTGEVERVLVVPPNAGSGWRYRVNAWDVDARGRLVVSARDKRVRVWDLDTGALLQDARRLDDPFFSPWFTVAWVDDDHVVTSEERGALRLWSVSSGEVVESWDVPEEGPLAVTGAGHLLHRARGQLSVAVPGRRRRRTVPGADDVRTFCLLDGERVVTVGDRGVEHRDVGSGRLLGVLPGGLPPWFRSSDPWPPPTFLAPVPPDSVVSIGAAGVGARWFPHRFPDRSGVAPPPAPAPDRSGLAMDLATFWSLVETSRRRAQRAADDDDIDGDVDDAQVEALVELLRPRTAEELVAFDRHFRDRLAEADTDRMLYAAADELGGTSDDGFLYFRCWLVGLGRRSFESVVDDPSRLARLLRRHRSGGHENVDLLGAAFDAWEERFGGELPVLDD
jgi:hypothetical protein